jgi:hypothetical protein
MPIALASWRERERENRGRGKCKDKQMRTTEGAMIEKNYNLDHAK